MTKEDLIAIGFKESTELAHAGYLEYNLGRNRQLSIGEVGTYDETLYIREVECDEDGLLYEIDAIELHDYYYDGVLTVEKVNALICLLSGRSNNL